MDPSFAEMLIANMPDAVVYSDRDGLIRYWNAGAVRTFGYPVHEAIGQSLDLITPDNLRGRHWAGFHETMRTGQTRYGNGETLSVPAIRKDGQRISIAFTIVPFPDLQGGLMGIAAIIRDVTVQFDEIHRLRKEIAEMKQRSQLASSSRAVSADLNR